MIRAATILGLLAVLLLPSAARARTYPCWMIRAYVATHTQDEVDEMARKYNVTPKEREHALRCLRGKK